MIERCPSKLRQYYRKANSSMMKTIRRVVWLTMKSPGKVRLDSGSLRGFDVAHSWAKAYKWEKNRKTCESRKRWKEWRRVKNNVIAHYKTLALCVQKEPLKVQLWSAVRRKLQNREQNGSRNTRKIDWNCGSTQELTWQGREKTGLITGEQPQEPHWNQ